MRVSVNGTTSSPVEIDSGLVQGSVLGPVLFTAFINKLAKLELCENSKMIWFADNLVLVMPILNEESKATLQADINSIKACIEDDLGLRLNNEKCKFMIFSLSPRGPRQNVKMNLGGKRLEQVSTYKYLGVHMDEKLNYARHVHEAVTKAKKGIGAICRSIRKWAPKETLRTAIGTIVIPALLYAAEVWYPACSKDQIKVERMQKYATRLIENNFGKEIQYQSLLEKVQWKPVYRQVAEKQLITMKKYTDGIRFIPKEVFQSQKEDKPEGRKLRGRTHSMAVKEEQGQKNTLEEKLAAARMRKMWNALTEEEVQLKLEAFEDKVKEEDIFRRLSMNGTLTPLGDI